jgi:NADPH:quinone reductase
MSNEITSLEVRSRVASSGKLELWLEETVIPILADDEVLIRVEASPINPSDIELLLGSADLNTLRTEGAAGYPRTAATVPSPLIANMATRLDQALIVGNEGAGTVVRAGAQAQSLMGRVVATQTPGMYAQYRVAKAQHCLVLPEGTSPKLAASAFINPLTALGMVETMRREGHTALVHTAAASNLGQMLNRVCIADGIALVNIVRSAEQAKILHDIGAKYVLDSTSETFADALTDAVAETGATLAFDAIGGGTLAATILASMETAAGRGVTTYNRYGSPIHKQVYVYGVLDKRPIEIARKFGMAWGIGGWLMTWFMQKIGPQDAQRLRDRVAAELTTTFASRYSAELSLDEALDPDMIRAYRRSATGEKYLLTPNKGIA